MQVSCTGGNAVYINVSLHDVTPAFEAEVRYLLDLIRQRGIFRGTLLVVPDFHGRACLKPESAIVQRITALASQGWEIALHGLTHRESFSRKTNTAQTSFLQYAISRWYTNGEGEFYRLSGIQTRARINKGLLILTACRLKPDGFVAPAWLMSKEVYPVLEEFDFMFTTTLTGIHDLQHGAYYPAPALAFSSRSAGRVLLSHLVVPVVENFWRRQELLRLVLHPLDARRPSILKVIDRLCQKMLAYRRPVTIREYLQEIKRGT